MIHEITPQKRYRNHLNWLFLLFSKALTGIISNGIDLDEMRIGETEYMSLPPTSWVRFFIFFRRCNYPSSALSLTFGFPRALVYWMGWDRMAT
jgi:hypothetical protein